MSDPLRDDQCGKWHLHKCGVTRGEFIPYEAKDGTGCGYVWGHGAENFRNREAHICPQCGRGPWLTHYEGQDCE